MNLETMDDKTVRKLKQQDDFKERKEKAISELNNLLKKSQKYSSYIIKKLVTTEDESERDNGLENSFLNVDSKYFEGILHPYQVHGVKWLKILFEHSINGILADEMGLGKTIQVISLICNLVENKIPGPYLIVAPLATLPNWVAEFKRFAPKIPVVLFYGTRDERPEQKIKIQNKYWVDDFRMYPVVVTSFQYPTIEQKYFERFNWQYIIIDEGHRIKNFECQLARALRKIPSSNRLILTGTPLQNNLLELWSLLNFILPQIFPNADTFTALFEDDYFEETERILEQKEISIIATIHGILGPFMLRRLKCDVLKDIVPKKEVLVYCPLSEKQKNLYKYVLEKNIAKLTGKDQDNDEPSEKRRRVVVSQDPYSNNNNNYPLKSLFCDIKMTKPVMLLKKIVNHPFSVQCPVKPGTKEVIMDEEIVNQSGKMMVLDAMLTKLKERGHKVLIFATLIEILDFIEDYLTMRNIEYCRLDGACQNLKMRQESIDNFTNNPNIFAFIISTRAGGLGLNLTEADTVIFFDRDWNPQVDLQAQDRCHRIGQKRPVMVYSLITKGTIDERILKVANAKRRLEKVVIKKGKFTNPEDHFKKVLDLEELKELLKSVENEQTIQTNDEIFSIEQLNDLLDRSELYKEMEDKKIIKN